MHISTQTAITTYPQRHYDKSTVLKIYALLAEKLRRRELINCLSPNGDSDIVGAVASNNVEWIPAFAGMTKCVALPATAKQVKI